MPIDSDATHDLFSLSSAYRRVKPSHAGFGVAVSDALSTTSQRIVSISMISNQDESSERTGTLRQIDQKGLQKK